MDGEDEDAFRERVGDVAEDAEDLEEGGKSVRYCSDMFNCIEVYQKPSSSAGVGRCNGIGTYVHRHHGCDLVGGDAWSRRKSNAFELEVRSHLAAAEVR